MDACYSAAVPEAANFQAKIAPGYDFAAAIPRPVTILGLRLLPLSLGRYRMLRRFESPFVAEGPAEAEIGDLLLGLLICSMRCDEFLEFIESRRAKRELKRWGRRIHREIRHDPHFSIFEKLALFREYLGEASVIPLYWEEDDSPSASGAHWSTCVENTLRADLGYSREEIEEGPLSKAIEDYYKRAEILGSIRLMTAEEIAMVRAAEAAAKSEGRNPKAEGNPKAEIRSPEVEAIGHLLGVLDHREAMADRPTGNSPNTN